MKRQLLIVGAVIVILLGYIAAANSARAATTVKKSAGIERADTFKGKVSHSDTTRSRAGTGQTATARSEPRTGTRVAASANYQIPWLSINSGGGRPASPNYQAGVTVGQGAVGTASSTHYRLGMGFWYGASGGGCNCPHQGDINGDGSIDVFDVIGLIDIAFGGSQDQKDPQCPRTRGDVNNDAVTDVFDIIYLIDTSFGGGPNPVDPCAT